MGIEVVLSQEGRPMVRLTDYTIQSVKFITTKTHDYSKQTRDIMLRLKFENSSVLFRKSLSEPGDNESEDVMPDEIDSVRDLPTYAIPAIVRKFSFLDGNVRIVHGSGQILNYDYRNLFVLNCSEEFSSNSRNTLINVHLREKAR